MIQHKPSLLSLATTVALLTLSGCYRSSTVDTPTGKKTSRSYALGIVSTDETNTMVSFDRCRDLIKPGRPGEQPMIDREVYDKCFADAMVGVDPNGQLPQPTPVDLDGDSRPDAVRYTNGFQMDYGMYSMYPGVYWPQVYGHYGLQPYMPMQSGYHRSLRHRGAMVGYPGDAATAGTNSQIVTKAEFEKNKADTDEAIDALATEENAHAKDIKRIKRGDATNQANGK